MHNPALRTRDGAPRVRGATLKSDVRVARVVARRSATFLKEAVILFGFLNGLWLALGVNPGAELLDVLRGIVESVFSGTFVRTTFALLPILLVVAMLYVIHRRGGWLGFVAVGAAFVAGLVLLAEPTWAFFLLLGALALGYVATN